MLVLERCLDTTICIGKDIKVKVLRTGVHRVQLGVVAPRNVPVWREELGPLTDHQSERNQNSSLFRVLLVEDDPAHARLVSRILRDMEDTEVEFASTGEKAIDVLSRAAVGKRSKPDLLLVDLCLPGKSGLDVLTALRSREELKTIPVVILSSSQNDRDVSTCLTSGANAFVAKATDYDCLRDSIFRIAEFWRHAKHVA